MTATEFIYFAESTLDRIGLPPTTDPCWLEPKAAGTVRMPPLDGGVEFALTDALFVAVMSSPRLRALIDQSVEEHMTSPKSRRRWWRRKDR